MNLNDINDSIGFKIRDVRKGSIIIELYLENWQMVISAIKDTRSNEMRDRIIKYASSKGVNIHEDLLDVDIEIKYDQHVFERQKGEDILF